MYDFTVICMKTKNDKTLYLGEGHGKALNWVFDVNEAIWFETQDEVSKFAQNYFKTFQDWFLQDIVEIETNL